MTLDRVSLHTAKGHFCSLLISNIFCYPLFLSLSFCFIRPSPKHLFLFSLMRIPLVFSCSSVTQRRMDCCEALPTPDPKIYLSIRVSLILRSILCVTPPCFFYRSGRSVISFASFEDLGFILPLDCTFLSSPIVYHICKPFSICIL